MMLFRGRPPSDLGSIMERLAADSAPLGEGWRLMGRGGALPGPLLFATPGGELTLCLIEPILEASLLSRGVDLLAMAERALPLLQACPPPGLPPPRSARLLLIGGGASAELLAAASPEWTLLLVCEVAGQPGPPLVLFPPLTASRPFAGRAREPMPQDGFSDAPLSDEEVCGLLAGEGDGALQAGDAERGR